MTLAQKPRRAARALPDGARWLDFSAETGMSGSIFPTGGLFAKAPRTP